MCHADAENMHLYADSFVTDSPVQPTPEVTYDASGFQLEFF